MKAKEFARREVAAGRAGKYSYRVLREKWDGFGDKEYHEEYQSTSPRSAANVAEALREKGEKVKIVRVRQV